MGWDFGIEEGNLPNMRERELETRDWLNWNVSQEVAPVDDLKYRLTERFLCKEKVEPPTGV